MQQLLWHNITEYSTQTFVNNITKAITTHSK